MVGRQRKNQTRAGTRLLQHPRSGVAYLEAADLLAKNIRHSVPT